MALPNRLPGALRNRLPAEKARIQAEEAAATPTVGMTELRKRRDDLAQRFGEMQYDLGGVVYEMAIRDHYRLDVVTKRAAELQGVDAELAEAERLLKLDDAAASGACRFCGSLHARGATFCWQCGERLLIPGTPAGPSHSTNGSHSTSA
ncbi:MAG: hypothetical protein NTX07_01640 [Solirubrobacterales bacterium]|nr:hypothetical protein [Solirubrobacterales bacterium]